MDLTLIRQSFNNWGIVSNLVDTNGQTIAVCLEHAFLQDDTTYQPKLNNGTHLCVLGTHQLDHGGPFQAYEITGIPGHTGVLFHIGNFNKDSDGCVLLGTSLGNQMILDSKTAFDNLMSLQNEQNFTLTVQ